MKTPATESTGFAHNFWLAYSEKHRNDPVSPRYKKELSQAEKDYQAEIARQMMNVKPGLFGLGNMLGGAWR